MKTAILSTVLLIVLTATSYAAPSILFTEEKHDFGEVKQGDKLEYEFHFKNIGDETLIIKKITAS